MCYVLFHFWFTTANGIGSFVSPFLVRLFFFCCLFIEEQFIFCQLLELDIDVHSRSTTTHESIWHSFILVCRLLRWIHQSNRSLPLTHAICPRLKCVCVCVSHTAHYIQYFDIWFWFNKYYFFFGGWTLNSVWFRVWKHLYLVVDLTHVWIR